MISASGRMLNIALPNKGALSEDAIDLVESAGYRCRRSGRELFIRDSSQGVTFTFLRPRDIATYVGNGVLDLGITGRDLLLESRIPLMEIMPLGFGAARLCYAAPRDSATTIADLDGLRIATTFTNLVSEDLQSRGLKARLVPLDGAVEVSIQLGVADAIADLVQTGSTLYQAGLKVIGKPILSSEAVLVARRLTQDAVTQRFLSRVRGILLAREYVIVEYDCPSELVRAASTITPGIEAPTIAPLSRHGWVAVKAMAKRNDANLIMDELEALGAKGILIMTIRTCRI